MKLPAMNIQSFGNKTYYLAAAGLVVIAALISSAFLIPQISKKFKEPENQPQQEPYKIYGDVVQVDTEKGTFTIKQKVTEDLFEVKLSPNTKIGSIGSKNQLSLADLSIGTTVELVSKNPIIPASSGSAESGKAATSKGSGSKTSSGQAPSEEKPVIEVQNIDEINVYGQFPGAESIPNVGKP